jgi:ubiquinone biosynthesis protein COQ9
VDSQTRRSDQKKVLEALLPNVPFDGWNEASLRRACREAGFGEDFASVLFPGGVIDVIRLHSHLADEDMAREMQSESWQDKKTTARIRDGILWRLEQSRPHKEAIRKALAVLSLPQHYSAAAGLTKDTINALWYAAGDTATDFNYYTKRLLLAGVYGSTLLAWLEDDTPDMSETRAFLERRLKDVYTVGKTTSQCKAWLNSLNPFAHKKRFV